MENNDTTEVLNGSFRFKRLPDGSVDKSKVICMCQVEFQYHRSTSSLGSHQRAKHAGANSHMENFILYGELGRGSSSVVYKGRRKGYLNYVAIIRTDKAKRPEITNHVRWSSYLEHRNIVSFYEWYETSSHLWLEVELCSGGSLETMIDLDEYLPEEVVKELGWGLVKGLKHIHESGIVFSGFTPAKILLDVSGVLKLGNFCLSKAEGETLEDLFNLVSTSEEKEGGDGKENLDNMKKRCQGPPAYSAPEVLQGSETSKSSDLWALGCILYYMYTGKPPFSSKNYNELIEMILHQEPPPLRHKVLSPSPPSEDFQSLLRGLLHKKTDKRMDWPELLDHPFWAQVIKEERELEEEKEEDGDGGGSASTSWSCSPRDPLTETPAPQRMENFILYGELGRGSSSVVYKGRRKGGLNYVAIIRTNKAKRPEITNHVRWSSFLEHPNIVLFYEWYETSSHLWLEVELCSGGSLETMIDLDEYLPEEVVKELGWGLVKGLKHIHESGVVFSGFTPAKILLDVSGILKLGNFCLSKAEGETLEDLFNLVSTSEEKEGGDGKENLDNMKKRCQGPPAYSAPEVLQGSETSKSSDLWALGCILYYMYTGKPPFYSKNYNELIEMILHQEPPPPRHTVLSPSPPSEDFQSLLRGLLHKKTDKRMDWPELLDHPFWAQVIKEERELEAEKEEDGDGGGSASTRHTRIPESFPSKVQTDKLTTSKPENKQPIYIASKQCDSSQPRIATTDRPSGKMSDSLEADGHTTHGVLKNSQRRRRRKMGGERREEREADTEDKQEPAETKQSCHTVQPNKSFTTDNQSELRPKSGLDEDNTEPFFLHRSCSPPDSMTETPAPQAGPAAEITTSVKALLFADSD